DIESLAKEKPEAIEKFFVPFGTEVFPYQFVSGLAKRGLIGKQKMKIASIIATLVTMMQKEDLQLAEINPLVITKSGEVLALDARVVIDDNATFRHPERKDYLSEKLRYTKEEADAKTAGMSYVDLGGAIGTLSVGAGLGMTTADLVEGFGGSVRNFLDVGGGASAEKVETALKIMVDGGGDQLNAILINAFGGITRTDDVARGIIAARDKLNIKQPIVVRLSGTNIEQALEILKEARMEAFDLMEPAIQKIVEISKQKFS
ncbi:MAG: ATP-grasp domain-containing protein, partial [Candidatus Hodarchaeales archaeon]